MTMDEDEFKLQPQEPNTCFDGIGITISGFYQSTFAIVGDCQEVELLHLMLNFIEIH